VAWKYERMGGGSPVVPTTRRQVELLGAELVRRERDVTVEAGFLYSLPSVREVARAAAARGPVLVVPLFPQRSFAGLGSIEDQVAGLGARVIEDFQVHPGFVAFHSRRVREALDSLDPRDQRLLFAAHSVPVAYVRKGDRYVERVRASVRAITAAVGFDPSRVSIAFQSRVGPVAWVGPSPEEAVAALPPDTRSLVVVPLSFIAENLETLIDLDVELAGHVAATRPDVAFVRTPAPTVEDDVIAFLADLVEEHLDA
jgi:ferrochelatase